MKLKVKNYKRSKRQRRLQILQKRLVEQLTPLLKKISPFIYLTIIIIIIIFSIILVKSNSYFKVSEIILVSDSQNREDTLNFLNKFKGTSLFNLVSKDLSFELKNMFKDIKNVYITKSIKGELKVEIVKEIPSYVLLNYSGIFILNHEGKVINILDSVNLNLTEKELQLIKGEVDLNDEFFRIKYLLKFTTQEEKDKVKWNEVSINDKNKLKEESLSELNIKIQSFTKLQNENIKLSKYSSLTTFLESNFTKYQINDFYNHSDLIFLSRILDFIKEKAMSINKIEWSSVYSLKVTLTNDQILIFSNRRDIGDQIKDLETIIFNGKLEKGKTHDLRTSNYSIS